MCTVKPPARRRGYILIEVMVGAALAGSALLGVYTNVGLARADAILQSREAVAQELALRELERARANGFSWYRTSSCPGAPAVGSPPNSGAAQNGSWTDTTTVPGSLAKYQVKVDRTCVSETVRTSTGVNVRYWAFAASARFSSMHGTTQVSASTRIYDR